jgi:hypothetical protein
MDIYDRMIEAAARALFEARERDSYPDADRRKRWENASKESRAMHITRAKFAVDAALAVVEGPALAAITDLRRPN